MTLQAALYAVGGLILSILGVAAWGELQKRRGAREGELRGRAKEERQDIQDAAQAGDDARLQDEVLGTTRRNR